MELGFEKTPGKYQLKQPHSGVDADIFWRNYALYSFSIFNIMDKVFFFTSYCNIQKYRGGMNMERDMTTGKPAKILQAIKRKPSYEKISLTRRGNRQHPLWGLFWMRPAAVWKTRPIPGRDMVIRRMRK